MIGKSINNKTWRDTNMAKNNSTPKGVAANRQGANQKKQKIIVEKKETVKTEIQKRQTRHNLNSRPQKNVKVPTSQKIEQTLEEHINNHFEEMAVSVAYAKNEAEKVEAVRAFGEHFNTQVPNDQKETIKAMINERLKQDDFIYGSEFIDLTGLRQYQDRMFEPRKVQKEFETHSSTLENKQPESRQTKKQEKTLNRPNPNRKQEQDLYQALADGINNEEIKNIKGYSAEDLKKIIAYHDQLLDKNNSNGTAFESLYENSISDLKKFANGQMMVDNDSYETMLQFIKIFGTNSKGELTPEGKAAYDKLMGLMAEAQKEKIRKNKKQYQQQTEDEFAIGAKDNTISNTNISSNEGNNNNSQNKNNTGTTFIPIPGGNNTPTSETGQTGTSNPPINPPLNLPDSTIGKNKDKDRKPKGLWGRFKDWGKRNWKKLAAGAALIGGILLFKDCNGDGKPIAPRPGDNDGNGSKPDTTIVEKPDSITLDASDMSNGFYLERSAGFKSEQAKISFKDAEKANKVDLLTIKKLIAQDQLDMEKFVRSDTTSTKEPITIAEIAYKMRIVTQNFPKSKMAKSVENMFAGKITNQDRTNIYAAFNHIDDYGNLINGKGKIVEGIPGKKEIDKARMGSGSKEYGTEGTANNFLQVLKNQRDSHSK